MRRALPLLLLLAAPAAAEPRNPLDALRLETLSATRARPLFAPSRRPPPPASEVEAAPAPVAVQPEPPEPPPYDLVGAVVGEHESYALLRRRGADKAARFRPGDEVDGWRIGAIGPRQATLERNGRAQSLALTSPAAGAVAAPEAEVAEKSAAAAPPAADFRRFAHRGHD